MRLLFDLDGTLTNSYLGISRCIHHALETLGSEIPTENLNWCVGPPLSESFAVLLKTEDRALIDRAVAAYRERFSEVGLFENELYDGIPEALTRLKEAGHHLSVATSKPTVFAKRIIDHFGLTHFFSSIDGAELGGKFGDKTSRIADILEREKLNPDDVVMIGDRKYDIIGAHDNGIKAVGVLWGFGTQDELEEADADSILASPQDLQFDVQC